MGAFFTQVPALCLVAADQALVGDFGHRIHFQQALVSPGRKKQSGGEKLLALWAELASDLDELDAYGGGDYDVRSTRGFGTRAASLAMKSSGSKMTCVVQSL